MPFEMRKVKVELEAQEWIPGEPKLGCVLHTRVQADGETLYEFSTPLKESPYEVVEDSLLAATRQLLLSGWNRIQKPKTAATPVPVQESKPIPMPGISTLEKMAEKMVDEEIAQGMHGFTQGGEEPVGILGSSAKRKGSAKEPAAGKKVGKGGPQRPQRPQAPPAPARPPSPRKAAPAKKGGKK